jgi:hypothetical protein
LTENTVTGTTSGDYTLVSFTNSKEPQTGSLKITKNVTVNGTATNTTKADGTYTFTITDSEENPAQGKVGNTVITNGQVTLTITGGASNTVTVTDLPAGTYTITEAAPTNGTKLTKVGINDITETSSEDDKTATVEVAAGNTTEVPTASFTNDYTTVNVSVVKIWLDNDNEKGKRPASLKVTLSNGHEETLSSANNWSATVTDLPKYNTAGEVIVYTWTEETVGNGYRLIGTSKEQVTGEDGVVTEITTLSNGPDTSYNPLTSFVGTKTWEDDGTVRPDEIVLILYKGEGANRTEVKRTTLEKPEADTGVWSYEFTNIPIFDENGNAIIYSVDEVLPNGYVRTIDQTTSSAPGYDRDPANDSVTVHEPNAEMTISTGVNLGFIVMKHGNDFIIWTPRKASATEIEAIKEMVAGEGNKVGDREFSQILSKGHLNVYGVPNDDIKKGSMTASIYMDGEDVDVHFGNKNWSQLAWGQLAYTYTKGRTDLINTQEYGDFEFSKRWIDITQQEIEWDKDIQVTVKRNKGDGSVDENFSLVYNVSKNDITTATGSVEFSAQGTGTNPKLKLEITEAEGVKKYNFKIEHLAYASEADGRYTYYVQETNTKLEGYLNPSYSNTSAPTLLTAAYDGGTIINQQEGGAVLPSTGGIGAHPIRTLGLTLITFAGLFYGAMLLRKAWLRK